MVIIIVATLGRRDKGARRLFYEVSAADTTTTLPSLQDISLRSERGWIKLITKMEAAKHITILTLYILLQYCQTVATLLMPQEIGTATLHYTSWATVHGSCYFGRYCRGPRRA
jgi:hypothetical protein